MAIKKKKISDFPLWEKALRGFFTIGYQEKIENGETTAESYKVDLGFVEDAAQAADTATGQAQAATTQAQEATSGARQAETTALESGVQAQEAATQALAAAGNADQKAAYAEAQGDYAHEQGASIDAKIGGKVDRTEVGQARGVAALDPDAHVPLAQLGALRADVQPAAALGDDDRLLIAGTTDENPVLSVTAREFTASIPYVGENLIPCSAAFWEQGAFDSSGNPNYVGDYMRTSGFWAVKPGTHIASMSDNWVYSTLYMYDASKAFIGQIQIKSTVWINQTFELPENVAYVKLSGRTEPVIQEPGLRIATVKLKIERGSVATPWCSNSQDVALKIDYTSLVEQAVPGSDWVGLTNSGLVRPLVGRFFHGTIPEVDEGEKVRILFTAGVNTLFFSTGFIYLSEGSRGRIGSSLYVDYNNFLAVDLNVDASEIGRPYYVYAQYTKI